MSEFQRTGGRQEAELSPAAAATLDELLADIRTRAVLEARRRVGEGVITASDIVEAFDHTSDQVLRPIHRGMARSRALILGYTIFGVAAGIAAGVAVSLGANDVISLLIASTGLAFAASSALLVFVTYVRTRRATRPFAREDLRAVFIDLWISAESIVREIAIKRLGASSNEMPLTQLISRLAKARLLSDLEIVGLRKALSVRNAVMHSAEISDTEIRESGDFLANFLRSNSG